MFAKRIDMNNKIALFILLSVILGGASSCRTQSNAQRATKIAKKRYRHIKHDCNCHSYVYPAQEKDSSTI